MHELSIAAKQPMVNYKDNGKESNTKNKILHILRMRKTGKSYN
jgi:hypothetical protein